MSDQIQAVLNVLYGMDKEEAPYKVLLILNNVEEVSISSLASCAMWK